MGRWAGMPLNALCEKLFVEAAKIQIIVVILRRPKGQIFNSLQSQYFETYLLETIEKVEKVSELLLGCLNSSNVDYSILPASEISPLI